MRIWGETAAKADNLIRVNLLDWREAMREERRRNFLGALALTAIVSAGIIAFVTVSIYGHRIEVQRQRNNYLEQQIAVAEKKMVELKKIKAKRASLIRRIQIIEDLQQSRSWIVHYFDQIGATVPDGVFLTSLKQNGDTTTLKGVAESNARVSEYMVNLDTSAYLADPRLVVIKSSSGREQRRAVFTLRVSSAQPDSTSTQPGAVRRVADASQ